jgi:hypothetical protein
MHCPLSDCTDPVPIARAPNPFGITLDSVSVYFTSAPGLYGSGHELGKVFRVAK